MSEACSKLARGPKIQPKAKRIGKKKGSLKSAGASKCQSKLNPMLKSASYKTEHSATMEATDDAPMHT